MRGVLERRGKAIHGRPHRATTVSAGGLTQRQAGAAGAAALGRRSVASTICRPASSRQGDRQGTAKQKPILAMGEIIIFSTAIGVTTLVAGAYFFVAYANPIKIPTKPLAAPYNLHHHCLVIEKQYRNWDLFRHQCIYPADLDFSERGLEPEFTNRLI